MLTLTFLGVGAAFAKRNHHSNALFEYWEKPWKGKGPPAPPDDTLLLDFGANGPAAFHLLKEKPGFEHLRAANGMNRYPAIRKLFVTHPHADHIGGIEELALTNYFLFRDAKTNKPHKIELISSIAILVNLWDHSLKGGLNTLQNHYALLSDYFFIRSLVPGQPDKNHFSLGPYHFEPFATDHIQIERKYDWPSYGLSISHPKEGRSVFYSGDTRFDYAAYAPRMEAADLCFHDCQLFDQPDTVHATLNELRNLPEDVRRKMRLYHFGDSFDDPALQPALAEFAGLAQPHHRYVLFDGT
jgi:ribonuclease BN (tRNA processing enzyme)